MSTVRTARFLAAFRGVLDRMWESIATPCVRVPIASPPCTLGQVVSKKAWFSLSLPIANEHASLKIKVYVGPEGIRES